MCAAGIDVVSTVGHDPVTQRHLRRVTEESIEEASVAS
jgi:hypothetical protein